MYVCVCMYNFIYSLLTIHSLLTTPYYTHIQSSLIWQTSANLQTTHVYKHQSCISHMTYIQYKTYTLTYSAYFTHPTVRQQ